MSGILDGIRLRIEALGMGFKFLAKIQTGMNGIERETWLLEYEGSQFVFVAGQKNVILGWDNSCPLPEGFSLSEPDAEIDTWQWQLVTYRGFNHEGTPGKLSAEDAEARRHLGKDIRKRLGKMPLLSVPICEIVR